MIIDLSFPNGFSVNEGISDSKAHVKFLICLSCYQHDISLRAWLFDG